MRVLRKKEEEGGVVSLSLRLHATWPMVHESRKSVEVDGTRSLFLALPSISRDLL